MIIEDNFVKSAELLSHLRAEAYILNKRDTFWKNLDDKPVNVTERVCQSVFSNFCKTEKFDGFEYWVNHLSPNDGDDLDWHVDKDEHLFEKENKIINPVMGMVLYLHQTEPEGGILEIEKIERFRSVPNRVIIFDPSVEHRVTPTKSTRITLAANLWKKAPSKENFFSEKLIREDLWAS